MKTIRLDATIDESRRLELDLPADTPVGEAEVIVRLRQPAAQPAARSLLQFFETLDRSGRPRLSAEEVERWIASERNAWEHWRSEPGSVVGSVLARGKVRLG